MAIAEARAVVRAVYHQDGSFLGGDARSHAKEIVVELDVSSTAPRDAVRAVIEIAHRSCFVESVIRTPVAIRTTDRINGEPVG